MRTIDNWDNITPSYGGEGRKEIPGGYIVKITYVEDVKEKEYLRVEWDYTDGELAGAHKECYDNYGFWPAPMFRSYKQKAAGMFKAFIEAVGQSNQGFAWDWNEKQLVGKWIGIVTREEEYTSNSGELKTRIIVDQVLPAVDILNGNYTVRPTKRKEASNRANAVVDMTAPTNQSFDEDTPF